MWQPINDFLQKSVRHGQEKKNFHDSDFLCKLTILNNVSPLLGPVNPHPQSVRDKFHDIRYKQTGMQLNAKP
jgi:hypothetical protein